MKNVTTIDDYYKQQTQWREKLGKNINTPFEYFLKDMIL